MAAPATPVTGTTHGPSGRGLRRAAWLLGGLLLLLGTAALLAWLLAPSPPVVDLTEADPEVKEAVRAARQSVAWWPWSAERWGRLGLVFYVHEYNAPALICLAEAECRAPQDVRWPYYQGVIWLYDDPEASLPCFRRAAERGTDGLPRLRYAEALLRKEQLEEAEITFRRVLQLEPGHPRAVLGLGQVALKRGDVAAAIEALAKLADHPAAAKAANHLLAEAHLRRGDAAAAAQAQRKAGRLPDDPAWPDPFVAAAQRLRVGADGRIARARELLHRSQPAEALTLLQETIAKYPNHPRASLELAQFCMGLGDLQTAERVLREAIQKTPDLRPAQLLLGRVLQLQNRPADALAVYRRMIAMKPAAFMAHYGAGECLLAMNDPAGALAAFREALRYQPNLAEAHFQIGRELAQQKQAAAALEHLRLAVELAPDSSQAKKLLDEVSVRAREAAKP